MKILGLDTTTDVCSVAIFDQTSVIVKKNSERDFSHASLLNSFIEESLSTAGLSLNQLDAIAIATGPGSYTGLRVGASTAKGFCFGLDIPLIGIDALTSLANGVSEDNRTNNNIRIAPMIDARREEVYTATFDSDCNRLTEISKMVINQDFFDSFSDFDLLLCGNGYEKFLNTLETRRCTFLAKDADASNLWRPSIYAFDHQIFEKLDLFSPFYLSNPNITASKKNIFL
jgi:tRNA threonylcarbamoyladenosine biosynthesis protein TsaB